MAARPTTYDVTLIVAAENFSSMHGYWPYDVLENDGATIRARFRFPAADAALYQMVAWGDAVTIVDPLELHRLVLDRARSIVDRTT